MSATCLSLSLPPSPPRLILPGGGGGWGRKGHAAVLHLLYLIVVLSLLSILILLSLSSLLLYYYYHHHHFIIIHYYCHNNHSDYYSTNKFKYKCLSRRNNLHACLHIPPPLFLSQLEEGGKGRGSGDRRSSSTYYFYHAYILSLLLLWICLDTFFWRCFRDEATFRILFFCGFQHCSWPIIRGLGPLFCILTRDPGNCVERKQHI